MARVEFEVGVGTHVDAERLWQGLTDWVGHGRWIPFTRMDMVLDTGGVDTEFVATSGFWPLAIVDRMRVREFDAEQRLVVVEKLGPVMRGTAGFIVVPTPYGSAARWVEDVDVALVPDVIRPAVAAVGAALFRIALKRLERQLLSA